VRALKGFHIHASALVMINIALLAINVLVGGDSGSTGHSLAGACLGVHALAVFSFGGGPWSQD
jgi:hypothetical protein